MFAGQGLKARSPMLKGDGEMRTGRLRELKKIAAHIFIDRSHAFTVAEPSRTTSVDQDNANVVSDPGKPEFSSATSGAEGERGNETAASDQPHSLLAGLGLERAIDLRWVLRDIKGKRTKMSPVSPDDLRTLIEMNLVEMRDDVLVLTNEGDCALDRI
jgi:hypothetical protein